MHTVEEMVLNRERIVCIGNRKTLSVRYLSLSVLWQQLVDGVGEQTHVALGVLTDALHQLGVLLGDVIQVHHQGHLLSVSQSHLSQAKKEKKKKNTHISQGLDLYKEGSSKTQRKNLYFLCAF